MKFLFKNVYSANDLTIISSDFVENDVLIEYVIQNKIDLIITLNITPLSLKDNYKKIKPVNLSEVVLDDSVNKVLERKKVNFKLKVLFYFETLKKS